HAPPPPPPPPLSLHAALPPPPPPPRSGRSPRSPPSPRRGGGLGGWGHGGSSSVVPRSGPVSPRKGTRCWPAAPGRSAPGASGGRSEEHTSELQSLTNLVCRLL